MYEIPHYIEEERLNPPEQTPMTTCSYCGQDMFLGEDAWVIRNDVFCERCIDYFHTEIQEYEFDFESQFRKENENYDFTKEKHKKLYQKHKKFARAFSSLCRNVR